MVPPWSWWVLLAVLLWFALAPFFRLTCAWWDFVWSSTGACLEWLAPKR